MSDHISLLRAPADPGNTERVTATTPTMRQFPIHNGVTSNERTE